MRRMMRRTLLVGAGALGGAAAARLVSGEAPPSSPWPPVPAGGGTLLNDASELSPVRVARHIILRNDPTEAIVDAVRQEIADARREGRPVIASAARHSMGGQSLASAGTAITLDQGRVELDSRAGTYLVAAGTRWATVITQLDGAGFSPAVMQSNNDFGVASTFCVNAHGWPVAFGPFGSTVRSFRMVMADGSLVTCSREQNADLFALAMGGYGLAGIIVDLVVDMVPNVMLSASYEQLGPASFGAAFVAAAEDPAVAMAYGRLDVSDANLLGDALMITYRAVPQDGRLPAASGSGILSHASRFIYRAQPGFDRMKQLRWWLETSVGPSLSVDATRNSLMNEPAATLADGDPDRTDILHEYFVPPAAFADFASACRQVVAGSFQQLLNVTLRYVRADPESVLSYAGGPRIAAVLSFTQEKSARGEADMARMSRDLIARVIDLGGSYYLPYRLHADPSQMLAAYPRLPEFVRRKREVDPELRFRNAIWDRYMARV